MLQQIEIAESGCNKVGSLLIFRQGWQWSCEMNNSHHYDGCYLVVTCRTGSLNEERKWQRKTPHLPYTETLFRYLVLRFVPELQHWPLQWLWSQINVDEIKANRKQSWGEGAAEEEAEDFLLSVERRILKWDGRGWAHPSTTDLFANLMESSQTAGNGGDFEQECHGVMKPIWNKRH